MAECPGRVEVEASRDHWLVCYQIHSGNRCHVGSSLRKSLFCFVIRRNSRSGFPPAFNFKFEHVPWIVGSEVNIEPLQRDHMRLEKPCQRCVSYDQPDVSSAGRLQCAALPIKVRSKRLYYRPWHVTDSISQQWHAQHIASVSPSSCVRFHFPLLADRFCIYSALGSVTLSSYPISSPL